MDDVDSGTSCAQAWQVRAVELTVQCHGTMEPNIVAMVVSFLAAPLAAGAAYGGVRQGLNGIHRDIIRHQSSIDRNGENITKVAEEVSYIKGQLDQK